MALAVMRNQHVRLSHQSRTHTCSQIIRGVFCTVQMANARGPQLRRKGFLLLGLQSEHSAAFIAHTGSFPGPTNDADSCLCARIQTLVRQSLRDAVVACMVKGRNKVRPWFRPCLSKLDSHLSKILAWGPHNHLPRFKRRVSYGDRLASDFAAAAGAARSWRTFRGRVRIGDWLCWSQLLCPVC
jgi:hypothetical protein